VGGKAQLASYNAIIGNLKLSYSQFEELENYARFGTRMDEDTQNIIDHRKRIRVWLKQNELEPISVPKQIIVLFALTYGMFDKVAVEKMQEVEAALMNSSEQLSSKLLEKLFGNNKMNDAELDEMRTIVSETISSFGNDKTEPDSN